MSKMRKNLLSGECSGGEMSEFDRKMKIRYGEVRKEDMGVPWACDCAAEIHVATSNEATGTRGMRYFSCPYEISDGPGQGCGFRRWWTSSLQDEFVLIRDEKNEMKDELAAAKKQIDDLQKKYNELSSKYERLNQRRQYL